MTDKTNLLKLDLDGDKAFDEFLDRTWIIKALGVGIVKVAVYNTEHGAHVFLRLADLIPAGQAILFQSMLGSDFKHCLGAYCRLRNHTSQWNVLFATKISVNALGDSHVVSEAIYDPARSQALADKLVGGVISPWSGLSKEEGVQVSDKVPPEPDLHEIVQKTINLQLNAGHWRIEADGIGYHSWDQQNILDYFDGILQTMAREARPLQSQDPEKVKRNP